MAKRSSRSKISGINRVTTGRKIQLVLVFLLAQSMFFYSDCFKIRHVHVTGYDKIPVTEILSASELKPWGAVMPDHRGPGPWALVPAFYPHLTEVSLSKLRGRIEDLLWVQHVSVGYRFPSEVDIHVTERHPVILVACDDGRPQLMSGRWRSLDWYAVDAEGLILEQVESPQHGGLPRLLVDRPLRTRKKMGVAPIDKVLEWAPVLKKACDNSIAYFRVDRMGQVSFVTPLVHRPTLVRIGAPEKEFKVQVLRMLCERIEREGRPVDYVDLRFAYPAIRYPKPVALKPPGVGVSAAAAHPVSTVSHPPSAGSAVAKLTPAHAAPPHH